MCLAVPGKILSRTGDDSAQAIGPSATVDFQGTRLDVSLVFTPEANQGDWVLVHAGFALQVLDEREAQETWKYLQPEDLEELADAEPGLRPGGEPER